MASICNDEQGCFGVMSGHDRKTLRLSVLIRGIVPGKQHAGVAEAREIADAHRVQRADQVIAFVLHYPRMKTLGLSLDALPLRVEADFSKGAANSCSISRRTL